MSRFENYFDRLAFLLGIAFSLTAIYVSGPSEAINEGLLRGAAVMIGGVIVFMIKPLAKTFPDAPTAAKLVLWLVDLVLLVALAVAVVNLFNILDALWDGLFILELPELTIGLFGALVMIELTRRVFGSILAAVCLIAFAYAFVGPWMPGFLAHPGLSFEETIRTIWYSFDGVFGFPVGVVSSLVLVFIVFGALLEGTGAGAILLKMAVAATCRIRGGPAHAAIVASAMFGTINGNPIANVVGTGVFTIPMIRKQGFPNAFAGAVEAAASSGGQFTPPIMAAVAFIMADLVGQPYIIVAGAALIPAALYYYSLFSTVYTEAVKRGIGTAEPEKLTPNDWLQSIRFIIPLVVVITVMLLGRSPALAGFWGVVSAVGIAILLEPTLLLRPMPLITSLAKGGWQSAQLIVAVGAIGVLIAIINNTGLGITFAERLTGIAETSVFVALLVAAIGSLILGMGLPTLPAYLFIVLMIGPAITKIGIPDLLVHLFVLYYGVMGNVTPPFALTAYAAAPIAQANPLMTAIEASRVSLVGYLIPFVLIYNPSIALVGVDFQWLEFIWAMVRVPIAIWLVATGLAGYDARGLPWWERILRFALGLAILTVFWEVQIPALVVGGWLMIWRRLQHRRLPAEALISPSVEPEDRPAE